MKKIVFIFGTFNPITNAHIRMGELAKTKFPDARIVYIPSKDRFLRGWKGMDEGSVMDGETRLMLMRDALSSYGFEASDIEMSEEMTGRTYDTLTALHAKYPESEFYICMGTDKLKEIHLWYKGEDLIKENKWLIIRRGNVPFDAQASEMILKNRENFTEILNDSFENVSASLVREALKEGHLETIKALVPANVYEYLTLNREVYR